jgi:hypothetical protein
MPWPIIVAWTAPKSISAPVAAGKFTYAREMPAAYADNAHADSQLPLPVCVLRLIRTISQSITAPETSRIVVKLAGSTPVCFRTIRHSSELPANAIMASEVRAIMRIYDI